jgi:hypothetical protein
MPVPSEAAKLGEASSYDEVFSIVKSHVESVLGLHRAGLTMGLTSLPASVGAFHVLGSNFIVLNKALLQRVNGEEPKEIVNSLLYMLLLHEYLHSLGILGEEEVRRTSAEVAERMLGKGHPASMLITQPMNRLFPYIEALHSEGQFEGEVEIVKGFDSKSYPFIS